MFSCEFCEVSKNTFSYRTPLVATSGTNSLALILHKNCVSLFDSAWSRSLKGALEIAELKTLNRLTVYVEQ